MCTIAKNEKWNSYELMFDGKPSEKVRELLKANGYRWNKTRGIWYGFADISAQLNGNTGTDETSEKTAILQAEQPKANATPIKFYYNGIKLNGSDELIKVFYLTNGTENVCICADGYGSQLPRDLFNVKNDTDIYTDYFDEDSATVSPSHPLYKFVLYYAKKAEYLRDKRALKSWDNERNKRYYKPEKIAEEKAKLTAKIKAFERLQDVGQPTNADLLKIDEMNAKAEAERIAKEQEEERRQSKNRAFKKFFGEQQASETQRLFPLADGAKDYAVIPFSEHCGLYKAIDEATAENGEGLKLSILAADYLLRILDERQSDDRETVRGSGWYDKTDFTIYKDGEAVYSGRYDIGDNDGGLIAHVERWAQWSATHTQFGGVKDKPTEEDLERLAFAEWLKGLTEQDEAVESLGGDSAEYQAYFA